MTLFSYRTSNIAIENISDTNKKKKKKKKKKKEKVQNDPLTYHSSWDFFG